MTPSPPERRFPGWVILAVLIVVVGAAALFILSGPRRAS